MSPPTIAINGRFQHLEAGGYRRYAAEVTAGLSNAVVMQPSRRNALGVRGRTWEQSVLARRASEHILLSPAGSGPLAHPRHVVVIHDLLPLERAEWFSPMVVRWQRRFLPSLVHKARRIVVPSAAVSRALHDRFPEAEPKSVVIRPAIGHPFDQPADPIRVALLRRRLGLAPGRALVGGLVATGTRKNSRQLLRVLGEVSRRTGAVAAVAGHDDRPRVVAGADRPAHRDVLDLGSLDDDDLVAFYSLMTTFVSLSLGEGYGMPVVEAAACGAAVVSSPTPATDELLGHHCVVVDPTRTLDVVDAVERLVRFPTADAAPARRRTARQWSWSDVCAEFDGLFEELSVSC